MKGRDAVSSTWWSQTTALTPTSHTPWCTPHTIRNTIQHYHTVGHLHDSHAGGHTETWGWDEQQALWDLITEHPHLTAAALKRRLCPPAPPISTRTIARYRRIFDFTLRHARVQARGAIGHHEKRADWAWKHRRCPITTWLHSDESTIVLRDTGEIMWAPKGDPSHVTRSAASVTPFTCLACCGTVAMRSVSTSVTSPPPSSSIYSLSTSSLTRRTSAIALS